MIFPWFRNKKKEYEYDVPEDLYIQKPDVIAIPQETSNNNRSNSENSQNRENENINMKDETYDLTSNVLGLVHNTKLFRGIDAVHAFMALNLELKGYNDAYVNSDSSHMDAAIKALYQDLKILIARAFSYYDDKLKDHAFHKTTRGNLGMLDLAMEIGAEEDKIKNLILALEKIEADADIDKGKSLRVITSYEIGFRNALSVITRSKLLNEDSNNLTIL